MTIIEKKSERKKKAIMLLVESGEMSIAYALMEAERLNDEGKLLDKDYEELAEWLESLLESVVEPEQLDTEVDSNEQSSADSAEETNESVEEQPIVEETNEEAE